jgi:hypothetical protein
MVSIQNYYISIDLNAKCTGTNRPIVTGRPSVREEEMSTVSLPNGEQIDIASLPWHSWALESFTMYRELSAARSPEEFARVRLRFQREWTFNGGFVSRSTIIFLCLTPS